MPIENLDYWINEKYWTIVESVYLFLDEEPPENKQGHPALYLTGIHLGVYGSLMRAIDTEVIEVKKRKYIKPVDVLKWAENKNLTIPNWMAELYETRSTENTLINQIFSEDHTYYSEELKLAIEVWEDMFVNGSYNPNQGVKKQIIKSLKEKKQKITNNACERIATVVIPKKRKKGGAPSSHSE